MVIAIATLIGGFIVFSEFIDKRISDKISEPAYIEKISQNVRPFLIINNMGQIIYDHGAKQKIKRINLKKHGGFLLKSVGFESNFLIEVELNDLHTTPPLLEYFGIDNAASEAVQGDNNIWLIYLSILGQFSDDTSSFLLRLELLE